MKETIKIRRCPQCSSPLPADAPEGLCPECLMQAAMQTGGDPDATVEMPGRAATLRKLPEPGDEFGEYRIHRELGRGGMGAVFEAEQLESGRRVALKVLSHRLDSPEAKARFFREGRLAASINHPNSVYVFGTGEIEETPIIAMELVDGGTLEERVREGGPLPVAKAVDAILQVIAGLEAAQKIGILHRDIKPANCFEDLEGKVKVGDFGLSISTEGRGEPDITLEGDFLGTPAFCSPEQLRGEELNARSDIYSVGVTLFYLLTGSTPFTGTSVAQVFANVLGKPAPSPQSLRPDLPRNLSAAVLRCLEKTPGERFRDYEELRRALQPFSSEAPQPANPVIRFVAAAIDTALISIVSMGVSLPFLGDFFTLADTWAFDSPKYLAASMVSFSFWLLYYAICEGRWGAALGKWICRIRVVDLERNSPGFWKALLRSTIVMLAPVLPMWAIMGFNPSKAYDVENQSLIWISSGVYYLILGLLFVTARKRNGWAAVQDLVSRTRVLRRPDLIKRPALDIPDPSPVDSRPEAREKIGPFHVLESFGRVDDGAWFLAYDTRLLRKTWMRLHDGDAPAVPEDLRNLGRPGRLRWIASRRTGEESWDAYEAPDGRALVDLIDQPNRWSQVRYWIADLAEECAAAEKDGTLPDVLALDRVWITSDGRAKFLDFPVPGLEGDRGDESFESPGTFLEAVAARSLGKNAQCLPLHVRALLDQIPTFAKMDEAVGRLRPILYRNTEITRKRRLAMVFACLAFPLFTCLMSIVGMSLYVSWGRNNPELMQLANVLNFRNGQRYVPEKHRIDDRVFQVYIASEYRKLCENPDTWNSTYARLMIPPQHKPYALRAVKEAADASPEEIAEAKKILDPIIPSMMEGIDTMSSPWITPLIFVASLLIYVGIPAIIAAVIFKGGLVMLIAGAAVARKDGRPAGRLRVFWRSLVTWSPGIVGIFLLGGFGSHSGHNVAAVAILALALVLILVSALLPSRSLQDRLSGTRLVVR